MPVIDKSLVKRGMFIQGGACPAITKHHAPEPGAVGAKLPPAATLPVVYGQSLTSPDAVAARLRERASARTKTAAPPSTLSTELTSPDAVAARLRERAARLREQAEVLKQARREQREREQQECEAWLDRMGL